MKIKNISTAYTVMFFVMLATAFFATEVVNAQSYGSYTGVGSTGYSYSAPSYTSYSGVGSNSSGCCTSSGYGSYTGVGSTGYSYSAPTYDSYTGVGSTGYSYTAPSYSSYTGVGNAGYSYDTYSYDSYTGVGSTGYSYSAPTYDSYTGVGSTGYSYTAPSYNSYTGVGTASAGCCDSYSYSYDSYTGVGDTGYSYSAPTYDSYTGVGDTGYAYSYSAPSYSHDYVDYSRDYTPYVFSGYDYSYTPTYSTLTYGGGSYDYVPYAYNYYTPSYSYDYNPGYNNNNRRGEAAFCRAFTADDYSVDKGDMVTLRWDTSEADDTSINNGVGSVSNDGVTEVRVNRDTTFTLTTRNEYGTDTCRLTVDVEEERNDSRNDRDRVSCDSFTVSDSRVDEGDYVTLRWRTSNANDVDINRGVGDVSNDGEERVRVYNNSTFTLTARDGRYSDTCKVTVRVDEEKKSSTKKNTGDLQCRLTVSDSHITVGQPVVVSWDNDAADRAVLTGNRGEKIFDTKKDSKIDEDKDAITLRPIVATKYTLTVYKGNKKETCTVETDIDAVVGAVRVQGGINLGAVPYTGFEAGPALTALFYGMVVVWGGVIAYILVIRKRNEMVLSESAVAEMPVSDMVSDVQTTVEETYTIPAGLPVMDSVPTAESLSMLELSAHSQYALVSSDALHYIAGLGQTPEEQSAQLDAVIAKVKAQFPKEGDWIVINKERVLSVLG